MTDSAKNQSMHCRLAQHRTARAARRIDRARDKGKPPKSPRAGSRVGKWGRKSLAVLLGALAGLAVTAWPGVPATADDTNEAELGAQLFAQLKSQGEVVKSSPLYATLEPIAAAITKVVQPQYRYPIHFYIIHESQPNAFASPGGNVYVIDSLLYFVKNREELAGTLCHETSHLLHHDSVNLMERNDQIRKRAVAAAIILGPTTGTVLATAGIARLNSNRYSRAAEEAADLKGADTCAAAGFNPWGLVWLFQDFSASNMKAPPELLSDHPNDAHRIARLRIHFARNPTCSLRSIQAPHQQLAYSCRPMMPSSFYANGAKRAFRF